MSQSPPSSPTLTANVWPTGRLPTLLVTVTRSYLLPAAPGLDLSVGQALVNVVLMHRGILL